MRLCLYNIIHSRTGRNKYTQYGYHHSLELASDWQPQGQVIAVTFYADGEMTLGGRKSAYHSSTLLSCVSPSGFGYVETFREET